MFLVIVLQSNRVNPGCRRRLISAMISSTEGSVYGLLLAVTLVSSRWGLVAWGSCRCSYSRDPRSSTWNSGSR